MELFADKIRIAFDGSMTLKFFNPLFNSIGSHSLPISVNAKIPSALKAFGFAGKEEAETPQSVDGRIISKLLDVQGSWQITEASAERIEAYYKGSMGDFYSQVGETLLTGLNFGGIKFPAGALATVAQVLVHMDTKMNAVYPTDEYAAFCAWMPNAYGDGTGDEYKWVNEVEHDVNGNPTFKDKGGNQGNDTVYLFVGTVIDYLFDEFGYRIGRNIFRENADLQHLVIFNTYNRKSYAAFDYRKLVPAITCTNFLKAITNRFNIGFFINEQSKVVDIISFDDMLSKDVNVPGCKFTTRPITDNRRPTGMHFPLNAPDEYAEHSYTGEDDFLPHVPIVVDKFRDIVPGALTYGNVYKVKSDSSYYRVVLEEGNYIAGRICSKDFPYSEGSGGTEVKQYSGIPGMYTYPMPWEETVLVWDPELQQNVEVTYETDVDMVMPRCDLEVTDTISPNEGFPLMFVFARGVQEGYVVPAEGAPASIKYPLGTVDIYDAQGAELTGATLALNWGTANGIIATFWTNRIYWELNTKKKVRGPLTAEGIDKLIDFTRANRIENGNYLVNSVEVELSPGGERIGEVELYRL